MVLMLVLLFVLLPIFLFIFHALSVRLLTFLKISVSNQKLLIYCIVFLNIPVLILSSMILGYLDKDILIGNLYALLVFNSIAYSYFHFFNMSETARRIKILINMKKSIIKSKDDISKYYNPDNILRKRLKRMEQLSQVEKTAGGVYVLRGRLLYMVAHLVKGWGILLKIDDRK